MHNAYTNPVQSYELKAKKLKPALKSGSGVSSHPGSSGNLEKNGGNDPPSFQNDKNDEKDENDKNDKNDKKATRTTRTTRVSDENDENDDSSFSSFLSFSSRIDESSCFR